MHDTKLVLVDRDGPIRGYYDGLISPVGKEPYDDAKKRFDESQQKLRADVAGLEGEKFNFPAFNATLNALAGALVLLGYSAVRQRLVRLHATLMVTALIVSALFLASYLYFHIVIHHGKPTYFEEQAPERPAVGGISVSRDLVDAHSPRHGCGRHGVVHGISRAARRHCAARPHRPLDAADLALRLVHRCRRLLDALPTLAVASCDRQGALYRRSLTVAARYPITSSSSPPPVSRGRPKRRGWRRISRCVPSPCR